MIGGGASGDKNTENSAAPTTNAAINQEPARLGDPVAPVPSDTLTESQMTIERERRFLALLRGRTRLDEFDGKTIVVVLPDSGERYLTGILYEGLFDQATGL